MAITAINLEIDFGQLFLWDNIYRFDFVKISIFMWIAFS